MPVILPGKLFSKRNINCRPLTKMSNGYNTIRRKVIIHYFLKLSLLKKLVKVYINEQIVITRSYAVAK